VVLQRAFDEKLDRIFQQFPKYHC